VIRRAVLVASAAIATLIPAIADARNEATIRGGTLVFFADTLRIVARNGARLQFADGSTAGGDAATIDLRTDRALIAGDARLTRGGTTIAADAIAVDARTKRVDVLDTATGVARLAADGTLTAAPEDADAFTFPDIDDKRAYIRSRKAEIVSRTSVRFLPATFPTSVGAAPVPMYLYTFAVSNGFSATSLSGAAFDQPYGLFSSPNALTSLHFRWINGYGPALGVQENLVGGNDGFIAASADLAFHAATQYALDGYQRIGELSSVTLNAASVPGFAQAQVGATRAVGFLTAHLDLTANSTEYKSLIATLRTRDKPIFAGITYHVSINGGFASQPGGLLPELPDDAQYATLWQHGFDVFFASPLMHGPFKTTLSATVDDNTTWYSFPHHFTSLNPTVSLSRRFSRIYTLFLGYNAQWTRDVYPGDQTVFYAPIIITLPDGQQYFGYQAYDGYSTYRQATADLQITPNPTTLIRLSYQHNVDFPQFDGYGRPPDSVSAFVQLRPFPNFGLALGRTYTFGWGGSYWLPQWTFSILP
jgi:hypothetical protein